MISLTLYGTLIYIQYQRVILGLSYCSLLFSMGTYHNNSFFVLPSRLSRSHLLLDSTVLSQLSLHLCRCHFKLVAVGHPCRCCRGSMVLWRDTTTAANVGGATLWPPVTVTAGVRFWPLLTRTTSSSAAVACPSRSCRGRRQQQRSPICRPLADRCPVAPRRSVLNKAEH